jgi:hypothetical protein
MNPEAIPPVLSENRPSQTPRVFAYAGMFVAGALSLLLLWCIGRQMMRKDTESDYVFLCGHLFRALPVEDTVRINLPPAMAEAQVQDVCDQLAYISRRGQKLAPIARQYSGLLRQAERFQENPPRVSPAVFGSAEVVLGLYSGQRQIVGEGGAKVLDTTENMWDVMERLNRLYGDRDALAFRVARLAKSFSGPMTNAPVLGCSFEDHTPGFLQSKTRHSLALTNTSGRELHNCVVAVLFSNISGNSLLNLYFVPDWQPGQQRVMKDSDVLDFPKDTVNNINEVDIGFRSRECSEEPFALKRPYQGWPSAS